MTTASRAPLLVVAIETPETRAIRETFEWANLEYCLELTGGVCENDDDPNASIRLCVDNVVLCGWRAAFVYCSRLAHTLPSDPLCAAMIHEWIDDPYHMDIDEGAAARIMRRVDVALAAHGGQFVCDLDAVTAADFLLSERLREIAPAVLASFPRVEVYLEYVRSVLNESSDEEEDEPAAEGTVPTLDTTTTTTSPPACAVM